MKLGMPTLVEFSLLEENIDLCTKLGLGFVELNMDLPYCMPDSGIDWKKIRSECDIDFTVHLSEKLQVGEIYEAAREKQMEIIKNAINYYKNEADIRKFNLHLDQGVYFTLPDGKAYIFEKYEQKYSEAIDRSFRDLSDFASRVGVEIYFENTKITGFIAKSFEKVKGYDNLYCTLDVGHNAKDGYLAEDVLMRMPDMIRHMHIHDFDGKKDHKELGSGLIDVKKYLEFCRSKNIYAVIEIKRMQELVNSIEYLKREKLI